MRVVVTGGSGFVGAALIRRLAADGHEVAAPVRGSGGAREPRVTWFESVDLTRAEGWEAVLAGAQVVVHAAGRVHRIRDEAGDALAGYPRVNVEGTIALARRATAAGARRFVFLSSIKVNGERTDPGRPFRADDPPGPREPYAIAKFEAEEALFALGRESELEIVVVRPPLVYGPGVKANFATMMRLVASGVPLPLGAVNARRSLLGIDNLVDLLSLCLRHPEAPGRVFLASDGEDLSVAEMLRRLGRTLGRPARLIPVPPSLLDWSARMIGRPELARRILWPLQVDSEPTRRLLGWTPPVSVDEGFRRTADHFRRGAGR